MSNQTSQNLQNVFQSVNSLSVSEIIDLIKMLEESWGVKASAPSSAASQNLPSEAAQEKTSFDVYIADVGSNKIAVIKEIRASIPSLGLAEAKKLVDSTPSVVKEGLNKSDAEEMKKRLEAAGCKIELK